MSIENNSEKVQVNPEEMELVARLRNSLQDTSLLLKQQKEENENMKEDLAKYQTAMSSATETINLKDGKISGLELELNSAISEKEELSKQVSELEYDSTKIKEELEKEIVSDAIISAVSTKEEIISNAKSEAESIVKTATSESDTIISKATSEASRTYLESIEKATADSEKIVSDATAKAEKILLEANLKLEVINAEIKEANTLREVSVEKLNDIALYVNSFFEKTKTTTATKPQAEKTVEKPFVEQKAKPQPAKDEPKKVHNIKDETVEVVEVEDLAATHQGSVIKSLLSESTRQIPGKSEFSELEKLIKSTNNGGI